MFPGVGENVKKVGTDVRRTAVGCAVGCEVGIFESPATRSID